MILLTPAYCLLKTPPPKAVKKATPAKPTPAKAAKNGKAAKEVESEDEEDDDSGKRCISGQM